MKRVFFLIISLVVLVITGCSYQQSYLYNNKRESDAIDKPLVRQEMVYNEDEELRQIIDYEYDEQNRVTKVSSSGREDVKDDFVLAEYTDYSYDEDGGYTAFTTYVLNGEFQMEEYDKFGRKVSSEFTLNGEKSRYFHKYKEKRNRLITKVYSSDTKELIFEVEDSYNEQGDIVKYVKKNYEGDMFVINYSFTYDDDGKIIEEIENVGDDYEKTIYEYDNNGLLTSETIQKALYNMDNIRGQSTRVLYMYDTEGTLVQKTTIYPTHTQIIRYTYY